MKKSSTIYVILLLLLLVLILSSCEFIIPKSIPLFIQLKDEYAWVTNDSSITLAFYTNQDINSYTIKINDDTITNPKIISVVSTSTTYGNTTIKAKKIILNLSNYTKISTNDITFKLYVSIKRGNKYKELIKNIYFGKLIKKDNVSQNDINSGYQIYELNNPKKINSLTINSTVIISNANSILINGALNINGGCLIIENPMGNSITLNASSNTWEGIKISNNGRLKYDKNLYILNAINGLYITSSNKDYEFINTTFNNSENSKNTGIYNDSQSNIVLSNINFYHCNSPIENYGTGQISAKNCEFKWQKGSIDVYGKTNMENCDITNLSPNPIAITSSGTRLTFSASPAIIASNDFSMENCKINGFAVGLYVNGNIKSLKIDKNSFENNTVGLLIDSSIVNNPEVYIKNNKINGKTTKLSTPSSVSGISSLKDCGIILKNCEGSIFYNNGIYNYSYGVAIFNDSQTQFFSEDNVGNDIVNSNVYTQSSADFAHTYWGTTSATEIESRINSSSEVNISPIATTSNYSQ